MEECSGYGGKTTHILDLTVTLQLLNPVFKGVLSSTGGWVGENHSGHVGEEKICILAGNQILIVQPITRQLLTNILLTHLVISYYKKFSHVKPIMRCVSCILVVLRTGTYEIQEAEGVQPGTKIVLHLKQESREFSDEDTVSGMFLNSFQNFLKCQNL
jgi:hypothetical protein